MVGDKRIEELRNVKRESGDGINRVSPGGRSRIDGGKG